MKLVIFGLSVSSSWGNGHATLWRALCRALADRGHEIIFYEKDVPYYAMHRDLHRLDRGTLVLYDRWEDIVARATNDLETAEAAIVTSYCPDALRATALIQQRAPGLKVFYDLDTPVTLSQWDAGRPVDYIGPAGLTGFDLVLSYTGGSALDQLQTKLGARRVMPLYGSVDPLAHHPVPPREEYRADCSYLGTYAADRQEALEQLFIGPARGLPGMRFLIGGAQYPQEFPWTPNIFFVRHVPPSEHPGFFCSARLTVNVTRGAMAALGYCPSGRLFEAAACGTAVLSDWWEGLDEFFTPGREILVARNTSEAIEALQRSPKELAAVAAEARRCVLARHTASHRARDLETALVETARDLAVVRATGGGLAGRPSVGQEHL